MDPLEILKGLRRRWPILLAAPLLAFVVALALQPEAGEQPEGPVVRLFSATHVVSRGPTAQNDQSGIPVDTVALVATSGAVSERVAERLGEPRDQAPALAARMSVTADSRAGTVSFTATSPDAEQAVALAEAFAAETLASVEEEQAQGRVRELAELETLVEDLEERLREIGSTLPSLPEDSPERSLLNTQNDALLRQYSVLVSRREELRSPPRAGRLASVQEAVAVPASVGEGFQAPQGRSRTLVAVLIGAMLGIGIALLLDRLDTRLRTKRSVEEAFGLPVVAEIPRAGPLARRDRVAVRARPTSHVAERYRALRISLQLMPRWLLDPSDPGSEAQTHALTPGGIGQAPRIVLVTSADTRDGKTTTLANLAACFAEIGKRVLLVDADLRNPELHRIFEVASRPGVTDYLSAGDEREIAAYVQQSRVPGVSVIASGSPTTNPGEVFTPEQSLLKAAWPLADVVLVDAGPLLSVSDAIALIPHIDCLLVVARAGRTSVEAAQQLRDTISRLNVPTVGVALLGSTTTRRRHRYRSARASKPSDRTWPTPTPAAGGGA